MLSEFQQPYEILSIIFTRKKQFHLKIATLNRPNCHVNYLLDTGACRNLILKKCLYACGVYNINRKDKILITGICNTSISSIGSAKLQLLVGNSVFDTKFYVVENLPVSGIIGADFIKQHTVFVSQNFDYIALKKCGDSNNQQEELISDNLRNRQYNRNNEISFFNNTQSEVETMAKRNAINFNARHENYKIQNFNSMDLQNEEEDYQVTRELDLDSGRDYDLLEHKSCQMLKGQERMNKILSIVDLKHLNNGLLDEIKCIIKRYNNLFFIEGDDLTYTNMATHEIETTTNIPINKRQYRMPESTKRHIDEQIDEMLKLKIIKPSKSPWNAPVLCVPKKDDANGNKRYRIVVDFRALNTITKQYVFPIPLINEILDNIGDSQYFSSIDLKSGFYQIPINPKDASKTAFSTSKGHFEFNRMPMGLKNSPSTFQKLMNTILYEIQPVKAFVYLDDIVIFGKTIQEHNENLCKVLEALKRNNLKIEPEKCNILKTEIKYLGHIIDKNGIRPTDENIKTIQKMEKPKTIKGVRSFLGTVNFYGKFIPNMADKRKQLNNLLKKNVKFRWTEECDVAFNQLKECLISSKLSGYICYYHRYERLCYWSSSLK